MDHMKLSDELRQQLMESAAWGKAGITPRLDESQSEVEETEEAEEVVNEAAHVCPLCVSELYEAIDEERILEHLNVVVGLVDRLSQLNEGDEDVETVIDETIQELLFQDLDEE
jgi:DNA repair exonuclease SbcCD ATPase subunit